MRIPSTHCPRTLGRYTDFNPIELSFAKLKAIVRQARCRSLDTLWPLLGACLSRFTPTECRNYVHHCGYTAAKAS